MAFSPAGSGQLLLYRVRLATMDETNNPSETLGDDLETVGGGLTRSGRPFPATLVVRGLAADLPDPYSAAQRQRRQLRSLMENTSFKLGGIYLQYLIDTELSGFFLIGGVDLAYSDGGFTLGNYVLTLRDALRVGSRATHRGARRFTVLDRRLATTPLDYRCVVYNTAFSAYPGNAVVYMPYNVSDPRTTTRQSASLGTTMNPLDADSGHTIAAVTPVDGQVISYEQADADALTGGVICYDRRGNPSPTFTNAGDIDSQGVYGWEEVYGSIYPYTAGDVPVIANMICRVRWLSAPGCFAIDWNKNVTGSGYTEMMRVLTYEETAAATTVTLTSLVAAGIVEYTDERAVVKAILTNGTVFQDVYIELQRGWSGPRFQQYTSVASHGSSFGLIPFNSGATTVSYRHNGATTTVTTAVTLLDYQTSTIGDEPWVNISPTNAAASMVASVNETGVTLTGVADTTAYGATRNGVKVSSPFNSGTNPIPVPYWNAAKIDFYASGTITLGSAQAAAQSAMFDARSIRTVVSRVT